MKVKSSKEWISTRYLSMHVYCILIQEKLHVQVNNNNEFWQSGGYKDNFFLIKSNVVRILPISHMPQCTQCTTMNHMYGLLFKTLSGLACIWTLAFRMQIGGTSNWANHHWLHLREDYYQITILNTLYLNFLFNCYTKFQFKWGWVICH